MNSKMNNVDSLFESACMVWQKLNKKLEK